MACLARVKRILDRDIPNGMEVSGTLKLLIRNLENRQIRLFFLNLRSLRNPTSPSGKESRVGE